ncbi:CocE/NonD family hydrolase [Jatrophihabitans telluris]|uniref:CocE/NonD family hydrolase n=1 Tax=Jatrophihabitans telluris TaxID=2038343 RepID=A0ABY4QZW6_9ACTN|nr:CocE/NonD family hydrolase [Jatrophihabitans telluris]UQX89009.1 CocE/NonD family hydrolase [Jatrophihabitans telluris]
MQIQRIGPGERSERCREFMIPMRDGVRLATDVYLPDDDGTAPGPTVLTRLPYDKSGDYTFMADVAAYFTARGYRVVVQDVRGKFRSEGETLLFVNEAEDGYDTIDWITKQAWSDGVVGMWGDSYYGFTQWAAVSMAHPALRAIVPRVTGTRLGELAEEIPGTHTREVEMGVHRLYALTMFHDRDILHWDMDWNTLPYHDTVEKFFAAVGSRSASYDLWYRNPVRLRRFRHGSPFAAPAVPVLMTIGWWDNCAPWQWQDHARIQQSPHWSLNEYLLIEAIDHENNSHFERPWLRAAGEPATDEHLGMMARYLDPAVEFFDIFLRGLGSPHDLPRVRWQLANADPALRSADTWPPPEVTAVTFYPANAAAAVSGTRSGDLADSPPARSEIATWKHDPSDPVVSPMPDAFAFLAYYPDERSSAARPDVLTFTATARTEALDLVGAASLRVRIESDGPEADVFARLLDVAPDGAVHLIARGQLTVLAAGYGSDVAIDLGQLGYRLPAGHALRLAIASSDAPEFVPAWGFGGNRWAQSTAVVSTQTLPLGGLNGIALTVHVQLPTPSTVDPGTPGSSADTEQS